jgi:AcrR family transcriptional regulator
VPDATAARRPGRPPDPEADRLILQTAKRLLSEQGYARMSMDAVARAAGVARTTLYRRYRDKSELVIAAIEHTRAAAGGAPPDTGSARRDLVEHLELARRRFDISLAGTMLVEEAHNAELVRLFRERIVRPRLAYVRNALQRGVDRGEIRADIDADAVVELLFGAYLAHHLAYGRPAPDWPEATVEAIWPAIAPPVKRA